MNIAQIVINCLSHTHSFQSHLDMNFLMPLNNIKKRKAEKSRSTKVVYLFKKNSLLSVRHFPSFFRFFFIFITKTSTLTATENEKIKRTSVEKT